jgi:hypothetical protein
MAFNGGKDLLKLDVASRMDVRVHEPKTGVAVVVDYRLEFRSLDYFLNCHGSFKYSRRDAGSQGRAIHRSEPRQRRTNLHGSPKFSQYMPIFVRKMC